MADFSAYNTGPSAEWAALAATLPPQPPVGDPETTPRKALLGMQAAVNAQLTAAAAEKMVYLAPHIKTTDHAIPSRADGRTVPSRAHRPVFLTTDPKPACLIWFHGNGMMFGTLDSESPTCARMALGGGLVVLHVAYRGTPQHVYPAAVEDAEDAVAWVLDGGGADVLGVDAEKVIVGGPSGGAYLTANVVLGRSLPDGQQGHGAWGREVSKGKVAGQVLMVPVLVGLDYYDAFWARLKDKEKSSMVVYKDDPNFGIKEYRFFAGLAKVPVVPEGGSDLRMNPGLAGPEDVKGLPPTVLGAAGMDTLRDEPLLYGKMLAENG